MKKKLVLLLVAAMAVSVFASGCGENEKNAGSSAASEAAEEPEVYTAEQMLASTEYDVEDYVKLANYKKISVEIDESYKVTDEAIKEGAATIIATVPYNMEVDRAAQEGDVVNIDYFGTIDGTSFEGGTAAQQNLTLGSDSYIDGFEDGLIGHSAGEEVVLNLTFPEDYSSEDLAGKDVQFEVTINSVMEPTTITVDEMTDDYVLDNFGTYYGLTTVDDFMATVESSLQSNHDVAVQQAFLNQLVAESEITLPEGLLDERVQQTIDAYEEQCTTYEMTLEEYLSTYYNQTVEEFTTELTTTTEETLYEELVLEALVAELDCEVSSEEFNSFVSYFASSYYMTEDEFIEQCGGKDYLILNYAEYYVALEEASADVKVTYVASTEEETTDEESTEE